MVGLLLCFDSVKADQASEKLKPMAELLQLKAGKFVHFQEALRHRYSALKSQSLMHKQELKAGDKVFVSAAKVHPLQTVLSYYGVGISIYLRANQKLAYPPLKYDNNQATFGLDGAKEAVIGPDKEIYLLDGHHTFTASLLAGAKSFPVKIVKNYAQEKLSMAAFRQDLLQQEHIYLTNPVTGVEGSLKFDFSELEDCPLRAWIDATGAEILATSKSRREVRSETVTPAWIRDANAIVPFAEFKVARILVEEGLSPQVCPACFQNAEELSEEVNETIRKYLNIAKAKGRFDNMPGIYVIAEKKDLAAIDLKKEISSFQGNYQIQIFKSPLALSLSSNKKN